MHELKQALFAAHFTDNRNISDINVLADIAAETGLDRSEALAVLEGQFFAKEVRAEEQHWQQQGHSKCAGDYLQRASFGQRCARG
ncbi:hypothetical protein PKHYL_08270 [Psychrobacter sp. KH172YL61]|nr:hypothetical protein PKHYL_08270 [Psychrobacter sp. KH172YL61]